MDSPLEGGRDTRSRRSRRTTSSSTATERTSISSLIDNKTAFISRLISPSLDRIDNKAAFIARLTDRSTMDEMSQRSRPKVLGIHHLKFAVSNLDVSIAWYERVMGAKRIAALDHVRADGSRFAAVLEMADWGGLFLELRQAVDHAQKDRGWDPVTLSVRGRQDLVWWIDWLDRWGTTHSPLLIGVRGWLLVFENRHLDLLAVRKSTRRMPIMEIQLARQNAAEILDTFHASHAKSIAGNVGFQALIAHCHLFETIERCTVYLQSNASERIQSDEVWWVRSRSSGRTISNQSWKPRQAVFLHRKSKPRQDEG